MTGVTNVCKNCLQAERTARAHLGRGRQSCQDSAESVAQEAEAQKRSSWALQPVNHIDKRMFGHCSTVALKNRNCLLAVLCNKLITCYKYLILVLCQSLGLQMFFAGIGKKRDLGWHPGFFDNCLFHFSRQTLLPATVHGRGRHRRPSQKVVTPYFYI